MADQAVTGAADPRFEESPSPEPRTTYGANEVAVDSSGNAITIPEGLPDGSGIVRLAWVERAGNSPINLDRHQRALTIPEGSWIGNGPLPSFEVPESRALIVGFCLLNRMRAAMQDDIERKVGSDGDNFGVFPASSPWVVPDGMSGVMRVAARFDTNGLPLMFAIVPSNGALFGYEVDVNDVFYLEQYRDADAVNDSFLRIWTALTNNGFTRELDQRRL